MQDSMYNGRSCSPNQSIKCSVVSCANHCRQNDYCGLDSIQVGTHEPHPSEVRCTNCESFEVR